MREFRNQVCRFWPSSCTETKQDNEDSEALIKSDGEPREMVAKTPLEGAFL